MTRKLATLIKFSLLRFGKFYDGLLQEDKYKSMGKVHVAWLYKTFLTLIDGYPQFEAQKKEVNARSRIEDCQLSSHSSK